MTDLAGYTYLGCHSEATGKRALSDFQQFYGQGDRNDVESCSAACSDYTYFGVEFGSGCYCGNNINLGSLPRAGLAPDETGCNKACAHNGGEYCEGGNRLNLYKKGFPEPAQESSATITGGATITTDAASHTEVPVTTITVMPMAPASSCFDEPVCVSNPCSSDDACCTGTHCRLTSYITAIKGRPLPQGECVANEDLNICPATSAPTTTTAAAAPEPTSMTPATPATPIRQLRSRTNVQS